MTQAQTRAASATTTHLERRDTMEWVLLEAGVALALAVFIVWFTMGGRRRDPPRGSDPPAGGDGSTKR